MSLCSNGDIIEAVFPAARKHIKQVSFCLSIAREVAFPGIQSIDRSILLLLSNTGLRANRAPRNSRAHLRARLKNAKKITPVLQAR